MGNHTLKLAAGYLVICLIWGSTWLFIKIGLESLPPLLSVGIRFFIAGLIFLAIIKIRQIEIQHDALSLKLFAYMAVFSYSIPFSLVYWGELYVESGLASILFAVFPFFVFIFSWILIPEEKPGLFQFIGIILGFAGIIIIFSENIHLDFSSGMYGMAAIVFSSLMQSSVAVIVKKYGQHLNRISMNLYPVLFSGIILIFVSLTVEDMSKARFDYNALMSVLFLSVFGTIVTFTIYYWLLQRINVVLLSLSAFITPIIAVLLGYFIADELLSFRVLIGSLMVLLGIISANTKGILKLLR